MASGHGGGEPAAGRWLTPDQLRRSDLGLWAINRTRGTTLATELQLALDPLGRLRGLIGRPQLAPEQGLLLRPCAGVHTLFMRYPIDVLFLGGDGVVVALAAELAPYRLTALHAGARATLELRAGALARSGTIAGDLVGFLAI